MRPACGSQRLLVGPPGESVFFSLYYLTTGLHGLHVLIGFTDGLRLANILMDEIRPYKDFNIKACREAQFSHGANLSLE